MTKIHHINCGTLVVEGYPAVVCHCLLLEDQSGLALIDTGIGLLDVQNPVERLGQELIDMAGYQFNERDTAVRRIESLGFAVEQVKHIVLTHCDPDHTGGLADFLNADIHVAQEELSHALSGHLRYVPRQFAHSSKWNAYTKSKREWFGLEARPVEIGFAFEVLLIPLFGHTLGHCGVAVQNGDDQWLLHIGDAYYLRAELMVDDHPVSAFAAHRADDNQARIASLNELRRLFHDHSDQIETIGYHDITELPNPQEMGLQR